MHAVNAPISGAELLLRLYRAERLINIDLRARTRQPAHGGSADGFIILIPPLLLGQGPNLVMLGRVPLPAVVVLMRDVMLAAGFLLVPLRVINARRDSGRAGRHPAR